MFLSQRNNPAWSHSLGYSADTRRVDALHLFVEEVGVYPTR